ncbi:MAG: hypothetical protein ACK55Z_03415, partial [bacterium]
MWPGRNLRFLVWALFFCQDFARLELENIEKNQIMRITIRKKCYILSKGLIVKSTSRQNYL